MATPDASIRVEGLDKLLGKFAKIDSKLYQELTNATEKSVIAVHKRAATYPPKRPSSKYRRTGTLGRRWMYRVVKKPGAPWGIVLNRTRYGKWVMGAKDQAAVHRGRWVRTDQIAEEQAKKINRFYEYAVEQAIK